MIFTCPKCGSNERIMELNVCTTCVGYPAIYNEKGENINPDRNISTHNLQCLKCGERFKVRTQLEKIIGEI